MCVAIEQCPVFLRQVLHVLHAVSWMLNLGLLACVALIGLYVYSIQPI